MMSRTQGKAEPKLDQRVWATQPQNNAESSDTDIDDGETVSPRTNPGWTDSKHQKASKKQTWLLARFTGFLPKNRDLFPRISDSQRAEYDYDDGQHIKISTATRVKRDAETATIASHSQEATNSLHAQVASIEKERQYWEEQANAIHQDCEDLRQERDSTVRKLQARLREIEEEKKDIEDKCNAVIRRQHEASLRNLETGRWAPAEESKIVGNLDRLRRDMRSYAKQVAIKDMSALEALPPVERQALMVDLSLVVVLNGDQLPSGLSTAKSPSLLLNALFAHAVYACFFRSPFFFLKYGVGSGSENAQVEQTLDEIYQLGQAANPHDAHTWRSDTLRLLLPPLGAKTTDGEKELRCLTESSLAKVSEEQASIFIAGPARHFINVDARADYTEKVEAIFRQAATLAYHLWTRRTAMKCSTLQEMGRPTFNIQSSSLVPHTLVRYDDHEDQLRGRPITVIVHPLLEVLGTDEGENYGDARVWVPAEVWLDSKKVSGSQSGSGVR